MKPQENTAEAIPLAAIKHEDGSRIDEALLTITSRLRKQGYRLAGAVRTGTTPPDENRCDPFS